MGKEATVREWCKKLLGELSKRCSGLVEFASQRGERRMVLVKRLLRRLWVGPRALPAHTLEALSPVDVDDAQFAIYESELLNALKSPDVKNVAITGGYGAGKSSLIKSFVRRHPEYRYAFISLASFEEGRALSGDEGKDSQKDKSFEDAVEGAIVQQLLYSVPARDVPGTRLRRISYATRKSIALKALIGFLSLVFYLRLKPELPKYLPDISHAIGWIPQEVAQISIGGVCFAVIYWLFRSLSNLRIQELNLKGIKWDGGGSVSVLHKHVDEIIHLFEMVPFDVVFVEDLDRFNEKSPFVRLREINFVINSAASIRHPVRFVYALNDGLFARDERAKFFDMVIPVVPVINSDNSSDMLMSLLETRLGKNIPHWQDVAQLLETIADYVGDMRQIKHLVNDFDIHRSILRGVHAGDVRKELVMAAIRCVYPQEYAALLRGAGEIKNIFSMFPSWIQSQLADTLERREQLLLLAERRSHESLQDAGEIMTLIWSKIEDAYNGQVNFELDVPDIGRLNKVAFIESLDRASEILSSQSVRIISRGAFVRNVNLTELASADGKNYIQRIALKLRPIEPDQRELTKIDRRVEELRSLTLQDALVDSSFIGEVSEYCDRKGLKLVPYFMRKGFLSTDYSDYIGYFYPGAMSRSDKAALLDIRSGKLLETDYTFDAPSVVLEKLSPTELKAGVGIIFPLVEQLLDDSSGRSALRTRRIQMIFEDFDDHVERIDNLCKLMHQRGKLAKLVSAVSAVSPWVGVRVANEGAYCSLPDIRIEIILALMQEIDPLCGMSYVEGVVALLAGVNDPAVLVSANASDLVQRWFAIDAAKLNSIDRSVTKEVLISALQLRMIRVNSGNVSAIIAILAPDLQELSPSYSNVLSINDERLIDFVKSDWSSYIESVYLPGINSRETEAAFVEMVRLSATDTSTISRVMSSVDVEISNIADLDERVWRLAAGSGRVLPTLDNVIAVASSDWIEDDEVDFVVGSIVNRIDLNGLVPLIDDSERASKVKRLLSLFQRLKGGEICPFSKLIAKLNLAADAFDAGVLDEKSSMEMVAAGLPFTEANFGALLSVSEAAAVSLAKFNVRSFSEYVARESVPRSVISEVLSSGDILHGLRCGLFDAVSVMDIDEYPDMAVASARLLSNEVDPNMLRRLYSKDKVLAVLKHVHSEAERINVLASVLAVAPWSDFETVFDGLRESGFAGILGSENTFEVTNSIENMRLLGTMSSRGWINKVDVKGAKVKVHVKLSKTK